MSLGPPGPTFIDISPLYGWVSSYREFGMDGRPVLSMGVGSKDGWSTRNDSWSLDAQYDPDPAGPACQGHGVNLL